MKDLEELYKFIFQDWKHIVGTIVIVLSIIKIAESFVPDKITINIFKKKE